MSEKSIILNKSHSIIKLNSEEKDGEKPYDIRMVAEIILQDVVQRFEKLENSDNSNDDKNQKGHKKQIISCSMLSYLRQMIKISIGIQSLSQKHS